MAKFLYSQRPHILKITAMFGLVAVIAVATCLILFFGLLKPMFLGDSHERPLYEQLAVSPEERAQLEEIEKEFEMRRQEVLLDFNEARRELARLLEREDGYSEEVSAAVDRLHSFHGQLQSLSIRRYFAMLDALPPDQQAELRRLAAEALSEPE